MAAPSVDVPSVDAPAMVALATLPVETFAEDVAAPKTKRMNYQPWEVVALGFCCHEACVSTVLYRSTFVRNHYKKYAEQCLSMYGLIECLAGTHSIEQSWEIRTAISGTGKDKGKSPSYGKYQEMVSDVANNILPLYMK